MRAHPLLLLAGGLAVAQRSCPTGEECVGVRSCPAVVADLQKAKAIADPGARDRIIQRLKEKVCGSKGDRTVCCWGTGTKEIGTFVNIFHDIAGTVHMVDDSTLLIKDFNYDGQGPDAFFLAGTSGRPSKHGEVVIPYPNKDKTFRYTDKDIPILGRFTGDQNLELKLPPGRTVQELKWLSVWCRDFVVDFGHANLSV